MEVGVLSPIWPSRYFSTSPQHRRRIVISLIPTLIVPYPFGPMITQAYRQHEAQAGITANGYLGSRISKHLRRLFNVVLTHDLH
jgi:hypothetical protein